MGWSSSDEVSRLYENTGYPFPQRISIHTLQRFLLCQPSPLCRAHGAEFRLFELHLDLESTPPAASTFLLRKHWRSRAARVQAERKVARMSVVFSVCKSLATFWHRRPDPTPCSSITLNISDKSDKKMLYTKVIELVNATLKLLESFYLFC